MPPYGRADAITDGLLFEVPDLLTRLFRFDLPGRGHPGRLGRRGRLARAGRGAKPRPTRPTETGRVTEVLWAARHGR